MAAIMNYSPEAGSGQTPPNGGKASALAWSPTKALDDKASRLMFFPVRDLCHVLTSMYPVVCSTFAMKSWTKKGAREANHTSLCELLEMSTNLDPNAIIPTSSFETLDDFVQAVSEFDRSLGRRLSNIALPPD